MHGVAPAIIIKIQMLFRPNAILFRLHSDSLSQASQLFERAVSGVMKKCALLYFTYADFEEQNMKFEKVQSTDRWYYYL